MPGDFTCQFIFSFRTICSPRVVLWQLQRCANQTSPKTTCEKCGCLANVQLPFFWIHSSIHTKATFLVYFQPMTAHSGVLGLRYIIYSHCLGNFISYFNQERGNSSHTHKMDNIHLFFRDMLTLALLTIRSKLQKI